MRKTILFFTMLLLLASFASAGVSFFGVANKTYNLGDVINASFNVSSNVSGDALFGLRIICSNYDLQYYLAPAKLSVDGTVVSAPALKVSSKMIGTCFLRANVEAIDNSFAELKDSSRFFVTDKLAINASLSKQEPKPADVLVVSAKVLPSYGVFSGDARVSFDGEQVLLLINKSEFSYLLELNESIKSGEHKVLVEVNDSFGNTGSSELSFLLNPVASELLLHVNKEVFDPEQTLRYYAELRDQAGDTMPSEISSALISPDGKAVFAGTISSNAVANFTFDRFFTPGVYVLKASAAGFETLQKITVSRVENIDVSFDNRTVTITNLGNVPYEKTLEVRLTKDDKDYVIIREVSLKPNESESIDLFKKVKSSGTYDVAISTEGEKAVVYEDVALEDKRSLLEKTAAGSGAITGNLFGFGGREPWLGKKPVLFFLALIALFLVYFLFSKGSKMRKEAFVKRKRDELEAERRKAEILEKRKLEEARKSKYRLDKSLREREDIKRFIQQQQEKMKNK
jgi:hypothetical protein